MQALSDPAALAREWHEVALAGHAFVIRSIGRIVEQQLRTLETSGNGVSRGAAARVAREFRAVFHQWQRDHPSDLEQVEQIDERIADRLRKLRAAETWALRYAGLVAGPTG